MAPATELATIPLTSGASIEDADSPAGKVWQSTLDTIAQQDGFQRAHWGREVENPSVLQLFVDWDSHDHHQSFMTSSIYDPFRKHLQTIIDGSIQMLHANLDPHPSTAALGPASPVTEILTCYVERKKAGEEEKEEENGFVSKLGQMLQVITDHAPGFIAAAGGWVIEDVEYNGSTVRAYVGLLGWESVEAHVSFREAQEFKDNIHLLREGSLGMELHHTKFVAK